MCLRLTAIVHSSLSLLFMRVRNFNKFKTSSSYESLFLCYYLQRVHLRVFAFKLHLKLLILLAQKLNKFNKLSIVDKQSEIHFYETPERQFNG